MFGSRLPLAERYADLLATEGVVRGLIGPREGARLWDRHLLNSAVLAGEIRDGAAVCDIGSGAGLPGMVLAIARPDLQVTLVEPLLRRTTFLDEVVGEVGLERVEVIRGRAESLHGARTFDVVTSRAVAPLGRLLTWSMPLVGPDGMLLALKGSGVRDEIPEARGDLARLGCAEPEVLELGADVLGEPTHAVRVVWRDPGRVGWSTGSSGGTKNASKKRRSQRHRGRRGT